MSIKIDSLIKLAGYNYFSMASKVTEFVNNFKMVVELILLVTHLSNDYIDGILVETLPRILCVTVKF